MTNQETIEKLQRQQDLLNKALELDDYIENKLMEGVMEELVSAKGELGMLPDVPSVYSAFPDCRDVDYSKTESLLVSKERSSMIFKIVLGVTIVIILIFFIFHKQFFNTLGVIGVFGSVITGLRSRSEKRAYNAEKDKTDGNKAAYEASVVAFRRALENYDEEKARFVSSAKEYGVAYRQYSAQVRDILARCEKSFYDKKEEFEETFKEIERVGVVSYEYAHFIPTMISMLQSSRADSLKEALNLAIEEDRAEREAEAIRLEEERRTALMEEQAREARRHNEQMEREAQMQSKIMQDQAAAAEKRARDQAYEEKRAREKEQWAESQQRHRCHKCANYPKCHSYIPNCGAFRAK